MKGFKETEIGLIPEDWEIHSLGKLSEIKTGQSAPQGKFYFQNGKYPFIRVSHLDSHTFAIKGCDLVNEKAIKDFKLRLFPKGTIVFPKSGASIFLEKRAMLPFDAYIVSHLCAINVKKAELINQRFLFYTLINSKLARRKRTNYPTLNLSEIKALKIPLPPIEEQKAIAKVLDSVRETIEKTENVIKALKEFKKSLMEHLFTYGAVPYDERDRVELRQTEIGLIPKHWEVKKFGSLYEIQQGKALSRKNTEGTLCPFLRTSNIGWGKIIFPIESKMPFTEKEMEKLKLKHGDLLICEGGEVGRTAIWKYDSQQIFFQNHIFRARAISKTDIYSQFHMYWIQYAILLKRLYVGYENKTTIPNLSRRRLSSFLIPVPPIEEQKEIAEILDKVDSRIEAEERKKEALEELFKTLLNKLMTGKIRVAEEFLNEFKETAETENG